MSGRIAEANPSWITESSHEGIWRNSCLVLWIILWRNFWTHFCSSFHCNLWCNFWTNSGGFLKYPYKFLQMSPVDFILKNQCRDSEKKKIFFNASKKNFKIPSRSIPAWILKGTRWSLPKRILKGNFLEIHLGKFEESAREVS